MTHSERRSITMHGVPEEFHERRGRNPALAEKAITEGSAYTEKEP